MTYLIKEHRNGNKVVMMEASKDGSFTVTSGEMFDYWRMIEHDRKTYPTRAQAQRRFSTLTK